METVRLGDQRVPQVMNAPALNLDWIEETLGTKVRIACQTILSDPASLGLRGSDVVQRARQVVRSERGEEIGVLDDVPFTSE